MPILATQTLEVYKILICAGHSVYELKRLAYSKSLMLRFNMKWSIFCASSIEYSIENWSNLKSDFNGI